MLIEEEITTKKQNSGFLRFVSVTITLNERFWASILAENVSVFKGATHSVTAQFGAVRLVIPKDGVGINDRRSNRWRAR